MTAGFQRDVNRRALRIVAPLSAVFQRVSLRVQTAAVRMPPFADNCVLFYDHSSYQRIRMDAALTIPGEIQRFASIFCPLSPDCS